MPKLESVFKKNFMNSDFIKKFKNSQSFEEIYKLCKKAEPNITRKEAEKDMLKLFEKDNQKEAKRVSDGELYKITGGKMDFNKIKTSAIAALIFMNGISGATASARESNSPKTTIGISQSVNPIKINKS